jgi:hypothetical protein
MTRKSGKGQSASELKYFLATLAIPAVLVGFPVAVLLGAIFGERIQHQDQSMMPFVIKCGLGTLGLSGIVAGIAIVLSVALS